MGQLEISEGGIPFEYLDDWLSYLKKDELFTEKEVDSLLASHLKRILNDAIAENLTFEEFFSGLVKKVESAQGKMPDEKELLVLKDQLGKKYESLLEKQKNN